MRTWEASECHHILVFLPKMYSRETILLPLDTTLPTHKCHSMLCRTMSLHLTVTLWACPLFQVDIVLVNWTSFMLWDTGLFWSFSLASRHWEVRVNLTSVLNDRCIVLWGLAASIKLPKKSEGKDNSLKRYSSYFWRYIQNLVAAIFFFLLSVKIQSVWNTKLTATNI